ncbi:MAG TPA: DUF4340 domain-containing protein [Candidatus Polarisedimenticolia bacterium]
MMKRRLPAGPLVALALLAGLGGWVIFKERPADEARRKDSEGKDLLVRFERSGLKGVRIENVHGAVRLEKSGDAFAITEPLRAEADKSVVEEVLTTLETARIERRLGAAVDRKSYGLDPPGTRITLELSTGGEPPQLGVGDGAPIGGGFFVLLPGGQEVAVASSGVGDLAKKDLFALRDKSLITLDPWKVKRLRMKRSADTVLLEKPDDGWKIQEPVETPADGPTVTDLLSALERLRASSIAAEKPTENDLRRMALQPANFSMTLLQEGWDVEKTIQFGKAADGTIYARLLGRDPILSVPSDFWEKLNTKLADLRRKEILGLSQYRLETITATSAGKTPVTLTRQKDGGWTLAGAVSGTPKADTVDLLLRHLGALKSKLFDDRPAETLRASLARSPALELTLQEEPDAAGGKTRGQHLVFGRPDRAGLVQVRDLAWRPISGIAGGDLQSLLGDLDKLVKEASEPVPAASPSPSPTP